MSDFLTGSAIFKFEKRIYKREPLILAGLIQPGNFWYKYRRRAFMFKNLNKRSIIQSQDGGLVKDVILYVKLIWSLMTDKRINFFLKLLSIASLVYLVSPFGSVPPCS
jgi:hypothetical protein